jgi:hypothetical protein
MTSALRDQSPSRSGIPHAVRITLLFNDIAPACNRGIFKAHQISFYPALETHMNKAELIDAIAGKANASKAATAALLNATLETIAEALVLNCTQI